MPMTTKERTELRDELVGQGYSWDYIDDWPSKLTLYAHREVKNPSGEVVKPVGTAIDGLPGQPDYVSRKARQGLLQWPPSESCTCRWGKARREDTDTPPRVKSEEAPVAATGRGKRRMGPHFGSS